MGVKYVKIVAIIGAHNFIFSKIAPPTHWTLSSIIIELAHSKKPWGQISLSLYAMILKLLIINFHIIYLASVFLINKQLYAHEILNIHTWKVVMPTMLEM